MKILIFALMILPNFVIAQKGAKFDTKHYPIDLIDSTIVSYRQLETKMDQLNNECNWKDRIGKKIDVFWVELENGDLFGHSFEYFLDCDNIRLIYWSPNPKGIFPIVDFMIENLEDESQFVKSKRKHLKNKKKYKKYFNASE